MNVHEVYLNAPVVLVVLEVRHPASGPLTPRERARLKSELGRRTPIRRDAHSFGFELGLGGLLPTSPRTTEEEFPKYFDRPQTIAVSIQSESTIIELSKYAGWDDCRDLIALVFESRNRVVPIDGVTRVGLRFINEIRVEAMVPDWSEYIDPTLLAPTIDVEGMAMQRWQGSAVFSHAQRQQQALAIRYGPLTGTTIAPGHDLTFRTPAPGEFFLLDLDSFTTPSGTPEYNLGELMETCDRLHSPLRSLFEKLITDKLRDEVLRRDDARPHTD